jgi:hypothetical protein
MITFKVFVSCVSKRQYIDERQNAALKVLWTPTQSKLCQESALRTRNYIALPSTTDCSPQITFVLLVSSEDDDLPIHI